MYEAFKPLGVISIGIAWAALLFLVMRWRGDKSMSFSKHAAAHPAAYWMMAIVESVTLPMYLVFIATWFSHEFQLSVVFVILNAIAVAGLLIAAWVPHAADFRGKIHTYTAYPAYLCFIFALAFIGSSENVGTVPRLFSLIAMVYIALIGVFILMHDKGKDNFLYLQASILASMHLSILLTTYI